MKKIILLDQASAKLPQFFLQKSESSVSTVGRRSSTRIRFGNPDPLSRRSAPDPSSHWLGSGSSAEIQIATSRRRLCPSGWTGFERLKFGKEKK